jgi:hypothetical protein
MMYQRQLTTSVSWLGQAQQTEKQIESRTLVDEEGGTVIMKTRLNEQALQNLQELLDAGFDSFQEYGEFNKTKLKSNE